MAEKQANEYSNRNITDNVYEQLADQLNALPNGFPRTASGVEIRLLKKMVDTLKGEASIERQPAMEGQRMFIILSPITSQQTKVKEEVKEA